MTKRQNILIGELTFKTKAGCREFFRNILNSYPLNRRLNETDFKHVMELLKRHSEYEKKIGVGVTAIEIRIDEHWGSTRGFHIVRTDGTITDFSYLHCLDNNSKESIKMFKQSARSAVAGQVLDFMLDFKNKNLSEDGYFFCEESQTKILWKEAHVDHIHPLTFNTIVEDFIKLKSIKPEEIKYTGFGDNEYNKQFEDENLKSEFAEYHRQIAHLRVISKQANLRMKKRQST